jgi:hypothetical protein
MTPDCHDSGDDCITSGDIARGLVVDLKTVHRWVARGALHGRRTKGGHLRFRRIEVVRFLRVRHQRIPEQLRVRSPRVLAVGVACPLGDGVVTSCPSGLFDALLDLASGEYDVVAVDLDEIHVEQALGFAQAMRRHAATLSVAFIGVTRWPDRRHALLTAGADLIVTSSRELGAAISYVTGEPVQFGPGLAEASGSSRVAAG